MCYLDVVIDLTSTPTFSVVASDGETPPFISVAASQTDTSLIRTDGRFCDKQRTPAFHLCHSITNGHQPHLCHSLTQTDTSHISVTA
ncbi:hypothetical protein Pmani_022131 [Petrolisthes manimaculis]|uniref:Uncharacterized protein n=1 Tax=Petrolisthes manimaculis TaxID=1843537 RepID=A0AAE1U0Y7_9EUCA|nr:hypothetical protein Pmani_022131 [Petrolisthes manimaculis]